MEIELDIQDFYDIVYKLYDINEHLYEHKTIVEQDFISNNYIIRFIIANVQIDSRLKQHLYNLLLNKFQKLDKSNIHFDEGTRFNNNQQNGFFFDENTNFNNSNENTSFNNLNENTSFNNLNENTSFNNENTSFNNLNGKNDKSVLINNSNTSKSNINYNSIKNEYDNNFAKYKTKCDEEQIMKYKKYIIKKLYRMISIKTHPDKSVKYKDGKLFNIAKYYYENKELSGMLFCAIKANIDIINFLDFNKTSNCILSELRLIIEKIHIIFQILKNN